jgi:hypothetical protein
MERLVLFNSNHSVSQAISFKACVVYELHWNQIEFHFHGCSVPIIDYVGNIIKFCPTPPPPRFTSLVPRLLQIFCIYIFYCPLISCCPFQADVYSVGRQTSEIALLTCFNCQQRTPPHPPPPPSNYLYRLLSLVLPLTTSNPVVNCLSGSSTIIGIVY